MRALAGFTLLLLCCGCVQDAPTGPGKVAVERIAPCCQSISEFVEPLRLVVRDERRFAEIWGLAYGRLQPAPSLPSVDFAREMVIVVAMGERGSGGYSIAVSGATLRANEIGVEVVEISPGDRCAVATVMTQPFDIVKLPAYPGTPRFETQSLKACL